jgi:aspartate racemase
VIGVVGGVGPFAGLDLLQKILSQTDARRDQEFLPVACLSNPAPIPDRTAYLLGHTTVNPAGPISEQLRQLESIGATVAGIPCNTAHAPAIIEPIRQELAARGSRLRLLHLIEAVGQLLIRHYPGVTTVGVLSTLGTAEAGVYPHTLAPMGFSVMAPDWSLIEARIQPAIYDPQFGIKAHGQATPRARSYLQEGVDTLREQGAEAIILGCTELPLVLDTTTSASPPLIDSTLALARALIRDIDPLKLRPFAF